MTLVAGQIDVLVLEGMLNIYGNVHSRQFASPEEVPVFLNFECFIPADRLQDVTVGDEAVADVVTPADRTLPSQVAAVDTQPTSVAAEHSRTFVVVAQGGEQIDIVVPV